MYSTVPFWGRAAHAVLMSPYVKVLGSTNACVAAQLFEAHWLLKSITLVAHCVR